MYPRISGSCKAQNSNLINQKSESTCFITSLTQVINSVLIMSGDEPEGTALSPQHLRECKSASSLELIRMCTTKRNGLESVETSQHTRISAFPEGHTWTSEDYQVEKRFSIDRIAYLTKPKEIQTNLCKMFGPGGDRYPCIVVLRMFKLKDSDYAKDIGEGKAELYRFNEADHTKEQLDNEQWHAMQIVAVNTLDDDPTKHFVEVKNTWGIHWGNDGFTRLAFDSLKYVYIPYHLGRRRRDELAAAPRRRRVAN